MFLEETCPICRAEEENVYHALFECAEVQQIWVQQFLALFNGSRRRRSHANSRERAIGINGEIICDCMENLESMK